MTALRRRLSSFSLTSRLSPSISGMLMSVRTISMSAFSSNFCSASTPFWANTKRNSSFRICRRNFWRISNSRSGSSSTTRILTGMALSSRRPCRAYLVEHTSRRISRCRLGQDDDELGVASLLALHSQLAFVLLDHAVVGDRQTQPGALPGWFGGEEGVEDLLAHGGRDAVAVIADSDLDPVTEVLGPHRHRRREAVANLRGPLVGGVARVVDDVEEGPAEILRHHVHDAHRRVVAGLQLDVEGGVLGTHPVISETHVLGQKRVQVGRPSLSGLT